MFLGQQNGPLNLNINIKKLKAVNSHRVNTTFVELPWDMYNIINVPRELAIVFFSK